jgi:hypothetical protein
MLNHVVSFYKKLFGKEPRSNIRLDDEFWEEEKKIFADENEMLEVEFSEDEILRDINESYAEGALGPDGFSFLFYQKIWSVIKSDLMAMVRGFEKGEVNMARIILIPKEEGLIA